MGKSSLSSNLDPKAHVPFGQHQDSLSWEVGRYVYTGIQSYTELYTAIQTYTGLYPGGGGNSYMEPTWMLVGNFEFNP